eukprot:1121005-Amphidinium_carterae.1
MSVPNQGFIHAVLYFVDINQFERGRGFAGQKAGRNFWFDGAKVCRIYSLNPKYTCCKRKQRQQ